MRFLSKSKPIKPFSFFLFPNGIRSGWAFLFSSLLYLYAPAINAQVSDTLLRTQVLEDVVIQATRTADNGAVPYTNMSAAQIAKQYQAQDIPFLLSQVPSLVESSDAGAGIGYTAMRIRGSDPTRVNVTINGVPLNDAESQGVFWVNLPDLAASAAEIQVQRGVGSSTNGPGAFGATVNIDLSKVNPTPFARLGSTLGSFNTRKYAAMLGTGLLRDHFALTARFSSISSDGFVDRATADLRSLHINGTYIGARQSVQLHILDGHERTYQAWNGLPAQFLAQKELRRYNVSGTEKAGTPHPDEVDNYNQRHFLLHYKRTLSAQLFLQLNGHYTRGLGYFEQYKAAQEFAAYGMRPFVSGEDTLFQSDLIRRRWLDNHYYGGTWALRWKPYTTAEFVLGGALSQYRGRHFGEVIWSQYSNEGKDFIYYDNDATKEDMNIFLKSEFQLAPHTRAMLDVQLRGVTYMFLGYNNVLENVSQRVKNLFFNPKAGLIVQICPKTTWYNFVGIGHREPNRDDFTQSTPDSRPQAERLYNAETGLRHNSANWSATANFFGMYYRNQLVLDGRINDVGAYIRTNVPQSYRAGLEVEAQYRPLARLQLEANFSLSENKVLNFKEFRDNWDTGEQDVFTYARTDLAFSPRLVGRFGFGGILLQKGRHELNATVSTKYVGQQYLDNTSNPNTVLPAYSFTDLRLRYDVKLAADTHLCLMFAVQNLLNAKYVSNGWTYRYTTASFDPSISDPYTRAEGQNTWHQAGYFPQAERNYLLTAVFEW